MSKKSSDLYVYSSSSFASFLGHDDDDFDGDAAGATPAPRAPLPRARTQPLAPAPAAPAGGDDDDYVPGWEEVVPPTKRRKLALAPHTSSGAPARAAAAASTPQQAPRGDVVEIESSEGEGETVGDGDCAPQAGVMTRERTRALSAAPLLHSQPSEAVLRATRVLQECRSMSPPSNAPADVRPAMSSVDELAQQQQYVKLSVDTDKFEVLVTALERVLGRKREDFVLKWRGIALHSDKTPENFYMADEEPISAAFSSHAIAASASSLARSKSSSPPAAEAVHSQEPAQQTQHEDSAAAAPEDEGLLSFKVVSNARSRPETIRVSREGTVGDVAEEYRKRLGPEAAGAAVQMLFDGLVLPPATPIADTELEDGDQLDAKVSSPAPSAAAPAAAAAAQSKQQQQPEPQQQPKQTAITISVSHSQKTQRFRVNLGDPVKKLLDAVKRIVQVPEGGELALVLDGGPLEPLASFQENGVRDESAIEAVVTVPTPPPSPPRTRRGGGRRRK
eukprot:m51a1_g2011 hypothetical protein (505) ;mRNA; f:1262803-1264687